MVGILGGTTTAEERNLSRYRENRQKTGLSE
jgi:hypothetical protein